MAGGVVTPDGAQCWLLCCSHEGPMWQVAWSHPMACSAGCCVAVVRVPCGRWRGHTRWRAVLVVVLQS